MNGQRICTQQLDAVCLQKALFCQLHGKGQTSLTAHGGQQAVRLFDLDDALYHIQGQRFDIYLVCHCLIGHDGSRIRVDEDNFQTFLFQRTASLCSCVVKLSSLVR